MLKLCLLVACTQFGGNCSFFFPQILLRCILIGPFFLQMSHVYTKRQNAIKKCVDENLTQVQSLKAQRDSAEDDPQLKKQLRKRQTVVSLSLPVIIPCFVNQTLNDPPFVHIREAPNLLV